MPKDWKTRKAEDLARALGKETKSSSESLDNIRKAAKLRAAEQGKKAARVAPTSAETSVESHLDAPLTTTALTVRKENGQFLPGNPIKGGRPLGVAAMARAMTRDGQEILDFWVEVMRNRDEKTADRIAASKLFTERMWGKALEIVASADLSAPQREDVKSAATELLLALARGQQPPRALPSDSGSPAKSEEVVEATVVSEPKDPEP